MTEINYKSLDRHIADLRGDSGGKRLASVILIHGEELLYKTALQTLLSHLLHPSERNLNYEPLDGVNENISMAIERVGTFSLLTGTKVVALLDAAVFHSKQKESTLLEKARDACDEEDLKKASGYFLSVLGLLNLTLADMDRAEGKQALKLKPGAGADHGWIDTVAAYCVEKQLTVPRGQDALQALEDGIEKGFPENNYLIITTEMVDKRQRLYKTIKNHGVVIDCAVPKGDRRADKTLQEGVLADRMKAILKDTGMSVNRDAYTALCDMTGFDLRTFTTNLEKLIDYAGERTTIQLEDVESLLQRTKKDPIYELTNAVSDRSVEKALFYLDSLLSGDIHPLQALAAVTNALRKLLVIKSFVGSPAGKTWHAGCRYDEFQRAVMPAVRDHDTGLIAQLEAWKQMLTDYQECCQHKKGDKRKKKRKKLSTDLIIAKSPNNPYPVYQQFKKSEYFTKQDLADIIGILADTDRRLKSTGQDPRLVIEDAIVRICGNQ